MKLSTVPDPESFIWRPFTQHQTEPAPIKVIRAENEFLFGAKGERYIDCISSWWTVTHGHNHPQLNEAIYRQIENFSHVMFAGFTHQAAQDLAVGLIAATDGAFDKVFFSDNGSSAVEVALKTAYQYHRNHGIFNRNLFLAFEGGYHGDTFGAMAAGRGSNFFQNFEPLMTETRLIPYPETFDDETDSEIAAKEDAALTCLSEILMREGEKIAAFIGEPLLQGAGGMRKARPVFFKKLCEALRAAGVLIIFDEVATGFGRTGSLFAYQQIGVAPDFICLSKGLTGGYSPLSVTMTHNRIFNAFKSEDFTKAFAHGHSFTGHAPACAAAVASLGLFHTENTLKKISKINRFYEELFTELKQFDDLHRFRTIGSVAAFEWKTGAKQSGYKSARSENLRTEFLKAGLNIRPLGNVIYLLPPYCLSEDSQVQIRDRMVRVLRQTA